MSYLHEFHAALRTHKWSVSSVFDHVISQLAGVGEHLATLLTGQVSVTAVDRHFVLLQFTRTLKAQVTLITGTVSWLQQCQGSTLMYNTLITGTVSWLQQCQGNTLMYNTLITGTVSWLQQCQGSTLMYNTLITGTVSWLQQCQGSTLMYKRRSY